MGQSKRRCRCKMFAIDERTVGKVGGQIVRGNVTLNVPLPLDNRAHISLSLSRFCPVFSPPPFHHPLVEPRRFSSASSLFFSPAPPPPSPASLCTDDFYQTQGREMTFVHFSNCDRERTVNENRAFGERRIGAKNKGKHESCENLIVN